MADAALGNCINANDRNAAEKDNIMFYAKATPIAKFGWAENNVFATVADEACGGWAGERGNQPCKRKPAE